MAGTYPTACAIRICVIRSVSIRMNGNKPCAAGVIPERSNRFSKRPGSNRILPKPSALRSWIMASLSRAVIGAAMSPSTTPARPTPSQKYAGVRTKEVRERLGDPAELAGVEETKVALRDRLSPRLNELADEMKDRQAEERQPLVDEAKRLAAHHRSERDRLNEVQEKRWLEDNAARQERLRTGLKGLWDRLSGKAQQVKEANAFEAWEAAKRDQAQRDQLILDQMLERRTVQQRLDSMRQDQLLERIRLDRTIGQVLGMNGRSAMSQEERNRERMKAYLEQPSPSPKPKSPHDRDRER